MTIEQAIEHGKEQLEIFGGEHKEFIETAIDTMKMAINERDFYASHGLDFDYKNMMDEYII